MNNLNQNTSGPSTRKQASQQSGALARALLESEKNVGSYTPKSEPQKQKLNPFAQALSKTGGDFIPDFAGRLDMEKQAELLAQQKKEALRKKLHDQINPVDTHEIFAAQAEKNLEELKATRDELKMLAEDVKALDQEIDMALSQEVVDPGASGIGFFNFFHKLREWINLLRQQVHSAKTWMNQVSGKGKRGRGTAFNFKKSKNVHDAMSSEKNFGMNMGA
ncbi:MAG: hypothetical protein GX943_01695 [Candidatus Pacebacteria bacterium]|jgi:hypothetical protein|nr:hypothetical protein [Candidatus Paceibacterota bacterium]